MIETRVNWSWAVLGASQIREVTYVRSVRTRPRRFARHVLRPSRHFLKCVRMVMIFYGMDAFTSPTMDRLFCSLGANVTTTLGNWAGPVLDALETTGALVHLLPLPLPSVPLGGRVRAFAPHGWLLRSVFSLPAVCSPAMCSISTCQSCP